MLDFIIRDISIKTFGDVSFDGTIEAPYMPMITREGAYFNAPRMATGAHIPNEVINFKRPLILVCTSSFYYREAYFSDGRSANIIADRITKQTVKQLKPQLMSAKMSPKNLLHKFPEIVNYYPLNISVEPRQPEVLNMGGRGALIAPPFMEVSGTVDVQLNVIYETLGSQYRTRTCLNRLQYVGGFTDF